MNAHPFNQETVDAIKAYVNGARAHHALWMQYQAIPEVDRLTGRGWSLGESCKAHQENVWVLLADVEEKQLAYQGSTEDWNENWKALFPDEI